jgi:hypothetical protein
MLSTVLSLNFTLIIIFPNQVILLSEGQKTSKRISDKEAMKVTTKASKKGKVTKNMAKNKLKATTKSIRKMKTKTYDGN